MTDEKPLTKQQIKKLVHEKCGGHCAYCGVEITLRQMHIDHVHPIHRFKKTSVYPERDELPNMLPACQTCNQVKWSYPLESFREHFENLPAFLERNYPSAHLAFRIGAIAATGVKVVFYFEKLGIEIPDYENRSWES